MAAGGERRIESINFAIDYRFFGNVDPLYCPSVLLPIRYMAHPTYCNSRPTTSVYFCIICGLGQIKTISGPRASARTGQGAERRGQDRLEGRALRPEVQLAAVKPRASRSDGQQDGWAQVQKYTIQIVSNTAKLQSFMFFRIFPEYFIGKTYLEISILPDFRFKNQLPGFEVCKK